jgi:pyrroline-5-carboxylate reductase
VVNISHFPFLSPQSSISGVSKRHSCTFLIPFLGTLGLAILSGILDSISRAKSQATPEPSTENLPARLPSRFIACVRSPNSVQRITQALDAHIDAVKVVQNDNVRACQEADVVLLGCKPYMVKGILTVPGMREALAGKLLISICAGLPVPQIEEILSSAPSSNPSAEACRVVRVMPNTAAGIGESMTVIADCEPALPLEPTRLVTWMFRQIGEVVQLPASHMDASTALCGSGPAFFALMLEAAADGAVAMGLPRAAAQRMAAQAMRGAAGLVLSGEHPSILRDKISTPGGCTIGGLLVLEEGAVRGQVARAVREATCIASQLGKGTEGVNGTRF